jgi:carboxypeptidase PM20D1
VPPFSGEVKDGFIWGRGSWDDKGNLFSMLEAAEQLAKDGFKPDGRSISPSDMTRKSPASAGPRRSRSCCSRVACVSISCSTKAAHHRRHSQGRRQAGGSDRRRGEGLCHLTLAATATPGHSSLPPRDTAIGTLSAALARLESKPFPASVSGVMRETLETAAPEMNFGSRLALSNLWLLEPLVRAQLEKTRRPQRRSAPPRR